MTDDPEKDRLYAKPHPEIADFVFDEQVAGVFSDMIQRSVPGYNTIINLIATLAGQIANDGNCYDLGCSLGAATLAIQQGLGDRHGQIIAVDNSLAMLQQAKEFLNKRPGQARVDLVCADIQDIQIKDASMVVLNFTLQFVPVESRETLLQKIYQGMNQQGVLVLSEKIALEQAEAQSLFTDLHHAFKKSQGYSDLEISQKRTALEKVLIPETLESHITRLQRVGFNIVEVWFQCVNFVSLLAVK